VRALTLLVLIFSVGSLVRAQNTTAAVLGTVRDGTGTSVVGAQVTVTNAATNSLHNTITNDLG